MADKKNSFILYTDLIHTINKIPDVEAGLLFKHILAYVNDENPTTDNMIVEISFEPIKQQLKRDLKVWEDIKETKSESGKIGNLKRWHKDLYKQVTENKISIKEAYVIADHRKASHTDKVQSHPIANIAVNDNVTVNVNDNDIIINKKYVKYVDFTNSLIIKYFKDIKLNYKAQIKTIRDLVEIDGYASEQIKLSVYNGRNSEFWQSNFLSLTKLRKQNKDDVKFIEVFLNISKPKTELNNTPKIKYIN